MKSILLFFTLVVVLPTSRAQVPAGLETLSGTTFPVYFSPGHEARALSMSARIESATRYHEELLGFRPRISLWVLSETDWAANTSLDMVYGMPHYVEHKLILAATDNEFWRSFFPPLDQLPPDLQEAVIAAYASADGTISAQPFFDLLAIHELGHAFHMQARMDMQRNWMGELFCNLFLHAYIASREADQLQALVVFPEMVLNGGSSRYPYTSLPDLQAHYLELARHMPQNYGWYQCRFHVASARIFDREGPMACRNLWDALRNPGPSGTDPQLVASLRARNVYGVADLIESWERTMTH